MKGKVGTGRGCRSSVPLPTAVLLSFAFFFAGYYTSMSKLEDIAAKREQQEHQRNLLLENGLDAAFEHGESGEDTINDIPFQILSWKPRALLFPRFANNDQCEKIIGLAKARLAPSDLALRKGETKSGTEGVRTSLGTFLSWHQDRSGTLTFLEEKISRATLIPRINGEAFNVLRYQIGQKYNSHYDVFNPAEYGPQKSQRMATFLLYLSDVEEGGETMFPFENYQNMDIYYNYKTCIGLKVKPRKGDALLFFSMHPNGTFDSAALHGSCPVIKGEKWVATKWLRDIALDR